MQLFCKMCPMKKILQEYITIFSKFFTAVVTPPQNNNNNRKLVIKRNSVWNFFFLIQVATRLAYGTGLVKLGKNSKRVIALDGDVKNSTFSIKFKVWATSC